MFEKAYLLRGFYQWCVDHHYQPDIRIYVGENSKLPKEYIDEYHAVIISINKQTTPFFEIENDQVHMEVDIDKTHYQITVSIDSVSWIRAKEVDEYLYFNGVEKYVKAILKNKQEERKAAEERPKLRGMKPEDIQQWIVDHSATYTKMMCISDWHIHYRVIRQDEKISLENMSSNDVIFAQCEPCYEYKSATIKIYASEIDNIESLKRVLIHELAHVATASFTLYAKYFDSRVLSFESERKIAAKLRHDIYELLAMQIETIIVGKHENIVSIQDQLERADNQFRDNCKRHGVMDRPILSYDQGVVKSPLEIVEEEYKENPDFWYDKYLETLRYTEEKKSPPNKEKERQLLLEQESDRRASYRQSTQRIIITGDADENKNYDFKKIILLSDYKKAA